MLPLHRFSVVALSVCVIALSPVFLGPAHSSGPFAVIAVKNDGSATRSYISGQCFDRNPANPTSLTIAPSGAALVNCASTSFPVLIGEIRYNNCTLTFDRIDPSGPTVLSAGPDCGVAVLSDHPSVLTLELSLTD